MKLKSFLILISIVLSFSILSCSRDTSLRGRIEGKWKITKVLDRSEDVTKNHDPGGNRWIKFVSDDEVLNGGYFESGRDNKKENTGQWSIKGFEIFIDSDAGDGDDSYWQVIIKDDEMHWIGQRFDFNKRFEIFYIKED